MPNVMAALSFDFSVICIRSNVEISVVAGFICVDGTEAEAEANGDEKPAAEDVNLRRPRPSNRFEVL